MENYLIDLIKRMGAKEQVVNSDESISSMAYREAETLSNSEYIIKLMDFILTHNKSKNKEDRKNILCYRSYY